MAEFCAEPTELPYLWWRAEAWAGKSALMSAFVLDPPPRVRVVSFFITARFAGQADRVAFSEVLLEQLLEILGEAKPSFLTEATREAHLLGALSRAAEFCHRNGDRLVLVIDGLDEDQGVTSGGDVHSIAALLPADPPADMRIILASRPNPSLPPDMAQRHPLRDPAAARVLSPSPHAEVIRQDAERELKRLLRGNASDKDLLGFVTAAGGGLSGDDLAHLNGLRTWEVEDHLDAVMGRTFVSRSGSWQPETKVFVLAHEELQQQAARFIGAERLAEYRTSIHRWADSYRSRGWPTETPDYLFRGYFRLLQVTGDLPRMLLYATDLGRHNRMLDLVGGDTSALAEVGIAQEMHLEKNDPDLVAISRLSAHRVILERRNERIPVSLPGVWAQLNRMSRAEALARSITPASRQIRAFTAVIRQVADAGDGRLARILSAHAAHALQSIQDQYEFGLASALVARAYADADDPQHAIELLQQADSVVDALHGSADVPGLMVVLARGWAAAGEIGVARRMAMSIQPWTQRAQALVAVVIEVSRLGYFETAQQIARSISGHVFAAQASSVIAKAMASAGDWQSASRLARHAAGRASKVRDPRTQVWALTLAADALVVAERGFPLLVEGLPPLASELLGRAEKLARSIIRSSDGDDSREYLARSLATMGHVERADDLVRDIANPVKKVRALAAIASGLATAGARDRALAYATEAETVARTMSWTNESHALAALAQAAVAAKALQLAEKIARSIPDAGQRDRALTGIVQALAVVGDLDRAMAVSTSIHDVQQQDRAAVHVVKAAVAHGQFERAVAVAESIDDDEQRDKAFTVLPNPKPPGTETTPQATVSPKNDRALATAVVHTDVATAAAILASQLDVYPQAIALTSLARTLAADGNLAQALEAADLIGNLPLRAEAYAEVANATRATSVLFAKQVIDQAAELAKTVADPSLRDRGLVVMAGRLAEYGDIEQALRIGQEVNVVGSRVKALTLVAKAAAGQGLHAKAEHVVNLITQPGERVLAQLAVVQAACGNGPSEWAERVARSIPSLEIRGRALSAVAEAVARAGDLPRAENIADSLTGYFGQAELFVTLADGTTGQDTRRLVAMALTVGDWQLCLPVLLRIEPEAVRAIAEEVARRS